MRIISPPCKWWDWPEMTTSASPSTTCASALNGASVFAQTLTFVESEERHTARRFLTISRLTTAPSW